MKQPSKPRGAQRNKVALQLRAEGKTNKQIGAAIGMSAEGARVLLQKLEARKARALGGPGRLPEPSDPPPMPQLGTVNDLDLDRIADLARHGLTTISELARFLGVPKASLMSEANTEAVRTAVETGKAYAKHDALSRYRVAVEEGRGALSALLIFELKQFGWSDRAAAEAPVEVSVGARDRIESTCQAMLAKWAAEARPA